MFSGKELKRIRKAAGLRQIDLAELAGIHPNSVCRMERGQFTPRPELLAALCKALNVKPEDFDREPEVDPNPAVRLDPREATLLTDWRKLPLHLQERVAGVVQGLLGIASTIPAAIPLNQATLLHDLEKAAMPNVPQQPDEAHRPPPPNSQEV